jgi:hypothetical protein
VNSRTLPFTLRPKRTRILLLFLISATFVAGGIWMIQEGEKFGWFCASFFGLGIPVSLLQLHPKCSFLTVSEEGIEFAGLFRPHKLRWSGISEFGVFDIRNHYGFRAATMVGFNYSGEYQRAKKARAFAKALTRFEAALPDTCGFSAEALAQLLSTYHREKTSGRDLKSAA